MYKSFLQSRDWGEFQRKLGREVVFEPVLAIKHELPRGFFYWYVPRVEAQVESDKFQVESNSKCVFIRVEPIRSSDIPEGANKVKNIQPAKTLVLDLSTNEEQLLSGMHPKTRYNIKLAAKHGVQIISGAEKADEVVQLITSTAKRQGFNTYPASYYHKMIEFFSRSEEVRVNIMRAESEGEILATGIYIDYLDTRTYLFGASSENKKNLMAPYLLHWNAILDAKKQGLKFYDFWGIETSSGETPGFVRFKMGFGGKVLEYPGAYDIILQPFWYNLYITLRKLNKILR